MGRAGFRVAVVVAAVACAGCSSTTTPGVPQTPVTLVLTNSSGAPLYAQWSSEALVFTVQKQQGTSWEPVVFARPPCMSQCTDDNAGKECAVFCDAMFIGVRAIGDGGSVEATWDGKVYPLTKGHCSDASCYLVNNPDEARYRLRACAHDGYACNQPGCTPPDDTTTSTDAHVGGTERCGEQEFSVPYTSGQVEVAIK